ncbi:hypothetical protein SAMN05421675_1248 [Pasteurella multocida]|nr:hypothetical protein SAMN05421675_1248 [Pasteurella multocida]VEE36680.1 Uncharacterised protein [Pasteurella multocida subsp. gallicida]
MYRYKKLFLLFFLVSDSVLLREGIFLSCIFYHVYEIPLFIA